MKASRQRITAAAGMVVGLALLIVPGVDGQTFTILHSFGGSDGSSTGVNGKINMCGSGGTATLCDTNGIGTQFCRVRVRIP